MSFRISHSFLGFIFKPIADKSSKTPNSPKYISTPTSLVNGIVSDAPMINQGGEVKQDREKSDAPEYRRGHAGGQGQRTDVENWFSNAENSMDGKLGSPFQGMWIAFRRLNPEYVQYNRNSVIKAN